MRVVLRVAALAMFSSLGVNASAADEVYRLGVQDLLRIYVHEWPLLSGEFAVGPSGQVALPIVGEVRASGLLPIELGAEIAHRLQKKVGLVTAPDASVNIAKFRPFYILGGVERPGEYPYRPGMLILNAVAIAGGAYRAPKASLDMIETNAIKAGGDLGLSSVQRLALMAKELRLKAEAEGSKDFPATPSSFPSEALPYVDTERLVFDARLEELSNQLEFNSETVALLESEIVSLKGQSEAIQAEASSVQKELDDIRNFVGRGLAQASRLLPLERAVSQLYSKQKEVEAFIIRAQEQINQAKLKRSALVDERRSEARRDLRALQVELNELDERERSARRLIAMASFAVTSKPRNTKDIEDAIGLTFSVIRIEGDATKELTATETTRVEPGDIIKVNRMQEIGHTIGEASSRRQSAVR